MKQYNLINNVTGWAVWLVATLVYAITREPTASLWDCGEFISGAYKLQIVHAPGAPFFLMLGRLFTLFATDVTQVASMVNLLSAVASSFAILFLFWSITHLAKRIVIKSDEDTDLERTLAIMAAGTIGALACTFSDTFWFSAVEGEVYALSSFFTALVFWAMLKWESSADTIYGDKWLLFIFYMMGLSVGVHLLNLLAIPALAFIYYFKNYEVSRKGVIVAGGISLFVLIYVLWIIIPGLPTMASKFELFFVNSFGLPFGTGAVLFAGAVMAALVYGIRKALRENKRTLYLACMGTVMIIIGYSSYSMVLIRSSADPAIDMSSPQDVFSFVSYLNREQYGDWPVFYGHYFTAAITDIEQGKMRYRPEGDKYVEIGRKLKPVYDKSHMGFFPRAWSTQRADHADFYRTWMGLEKGEKPNFAQNLKFYFTYQLGYIYGRYFMWNFSGRQNDIQGRYDDGKDGSWMTGFRFIDENVLELPKQVDLPPSIAGNRGRNYYYLLPFILGLLGLFYHYKRHKKDTFVVFLLFLFTGIMINTYLNPTPLQPRERDYAYVGSYWTYCIWIGLGVLAIWDFLRRNMKAAGVATAAIALLLGGTVPMLMASENWDDHDRSDRYMARDIANNYLESCPPNAILFTQGDNDTYPLWYAQEVEGIRTDVRTVNLSLLGVDWYIDFLKRKVNDGDPLPLTIANDKYVGDRRNVIQFYDTGEFDQEKYYDLKTVVGMLASDNNKYRLRTRNGDFVNYLPVKNFGIPVDKQAVIDAGIVPADKANAIESHLKFKINKNSIYKPDLMMMDLFSNIDWSRPICFATSVSSSNYLGLGDYFRQEGMIYRLVPYKDPTADGLPGGVMTDVMYNNVKEKFRWVDPATKDMYLNDDNLRNIMNLRNSMVRLADALIRENKTEQAIEMLDVCVEGIPEKFAPYYGSYSLIMVRFVELYYRAKANDKARNILEILKGYYGKELAYYNGLPPGDRQRYEAEAQRTVYLFREIMKYAGAYEDKAYNDALKAEFDQLMGTPVQAPQQIQQPPAQPPAAQQPPQKSQQKGHEGHDHE